MATLKSLVDETTNIKNELKTCHATLKDNLIEKGIECGEDDKMLDLINKVDDIKGYKVLNSNTGMEFKLTFGSSESKQPETLGEIETYLTLDEIHNDGLYTIGVYGKNGADISLNLLPTIYIYVNEVEYTRFQFSGGNYNTFNNQIILKKGDIVQIKYSTVRTSNQNRFPYLGYVYLTCYLDVL